MSFKDRIRTITIDKEYSVLSALKKMDKEGVKSLLLIDGGFLLSVISIGDIQRAIIKNLPMDTSVVDIIRPQVTVARVEDVKEEVRKQMMQLRTEIMPVVDNDNHLVDVYFWDDFFTEKKQVQKLDTNVPVVIMAGGFGTRLKPLTNVIPKALIPISEKTILEHIVGNFTEIGATQFFITVNYKHELIKYYMDGVSTPDYSLEYVLESKPLGTAGSLGLLKNRISSTFFVTNCDILIEEDYTEIYKYHQQSKNDITIVASLKHIHIPYGTLETGEQGELVSLKEKPEITLMINTGMYILEPHILDYIQDDTFIHITSIIELVKQNGGKVGVFPVSEKSWTDIGEWDGYKETINKYTK